RTLSGFLTSRKYSRISNTRPAVLITELSMPACCLSWELPARCAALRPPPAPGAALSHPAPRARCRPAVLQRQGHAARQGQAGRDAGALDAEQLHQARQAVAARSGDVEVVGVQA